MNMDVSLLPRLGQLRQPDVAQSPAQVQRVTRQFAGALDRAVTTDVAGVPGSPPVDVMLEVAAAGERVERLRQNDRELRFSLSDETGRVRIEVRDLAGGLIREIPPSEALEAMSSGTVR